MTTSRQILVAFFAWVMAGCSAGLGSPLTQVSPTLQQLASHAQRRASWAELRHYAERTTTPEGRGQAHFVLGYHEYLNDDDLQAETDFQAAVSTGFSLAELAQFYWGAAADKLADYAQVNAALKDFGARYPASVYRLEALALLGKALNQSGHAEAAIQMLTAEPHVRQQAGLALLLAEAYRGANRFAEAAREFQEVYFAFPTSSDAQKAQQELNELRPLMGADFPVPTVETQSARAGLLLRAHRYSDAAKEFGALLQEHPDNSSANRWTVQQARAQIMLRTYDPALAALSKPMPADPEQDAARLATLAYAYYRQGDKDSLVRTVEQLNQQYPKAQAAAEGLNRAGGYFMWHGDWASALKYYQALGVQFAEPRWSEPSCWYIAWCNHLGKNPPDERKALVDYLSRFPEGPRVPDALYWLARNDEASETPGSAVPLYRFLVRRFPHSYFALQARKRLDLLHSQASSASEVPADPALTEILAKLPAAPAPAVKPCATPPSTEALGPSTMLTQLGLPDLAAQYLRRNLREDPGSAALLLALARLEQTRKRTNVSLTYARRLAPRLSPTHTGRFPRKSGKCFSRAITGRWCRGMHAPAGWTLTW